MKLFPCAKINLGLNVVAVREDGYHEIETVFYPVKSLHDTLTVDVLECSSDDFKLQLDGNAIKGAIEDNLVTRAFRLMNKSFNFPPIEVKLNKKIPSEAGLGGGSSDAASMIVALNNLFQLNLNTKQMQEYAQQIGADCPFFITGEPVYATGIGDVFSPLPQLSNKLKGLYIVIIKPDVAVSTREAYDSIPCRKTDISCKEIIDYPIEAWKDILRNDFELYAFDKYPVLAGIKQQLYNAGAIYAQMSGSGSAMFGLFSDKPDIITDMPSDYFTHITQL